MLRTAEAVPVASLQGKREPVSVEVPRGHLEATYHRVQLAVRGHISDHEVDPVASEGLLHG